MSTKEAMDLGGSGRRKGSAPKAGSVWESRMKSDEVKGGIKVFNAAHETSQEQTQDSCSINGASTSVTNIEVQMDKVLPKQSPVGKRKTWKSESLEGSPVKIAGLRSELSKNLDENCKELSVSSDGIKKSPVTIKKTRSGLTNPSGDGNQRNGIQTRRVKSDSTEVTTELSKNLDESCTGNLNNSDVKAKTVVERKVSDEKIKNLGDGKVANESRSDEDCNEFDVCEEKAITSNVGQIKNPYSDSDEFIKDEADLDEENGKIEVENKDLDIKEITVRDHKPKKILIEEKKSLHSNEKSQVVKQQPPPAVNHAIFHPTPTKINPSKNHSFPVSDNFPGIQRTNSKLQSFADLVMWRDVSKSAFVFGIGTFAIISSSYTKDFNISFISVLSYVGLVYLAGIFLFRSLISRGSRKMNSADQEYVVGDEEAIWVVKLVLPYVNEFLVKLRALFSGDPATTMKLAVLLFILARCGSSITIWKMAKLGFIGVFTVPKVCSTYSSQLTAYGKFWIRRFEDAWESCSHKKAVGFAIFTLIWNLSSVVARIWAVFMLFVAFKYYQQSLIKDGWVEEAGTRTSSDDATRQKQSVGELKSGRRFILTDIKKQKKVF